MEKNFLVTEDEKTDKSKAVRELLSAAVKEKLLGIALEKYSKWLVSLGKAAELARVEEIIEKMKRTGDIAEPRYGFIERL